MKSLLTVAFVVASLVPAGAVTGRDIEISFPDTPGFPRVVLTPEELPAFRARASLPWAQPIRDQILREADALVEAPLDIPHSEGQWTHWYSCKADAARLKSLDAHRHICPTCGTVYTGYPYDAVYVALRHSYWLGGVRTLGLAYALRPERRYAIRARDILLEYASFYTDLRLHNKYDQNSQSKARLFAQTLDEAVALCDIVTGYDLVYDAPAFSRIDHGVINRQLLRQMVKTIQGNDAGISNWQSWHNAAVAMTACLLRDERLLKWALHGKSGFTYQLRRSLMETGVWYEESPVYHWYALRAHVHLLEAAARAGIPLYEHPRVQSMFQGPLRTVLPDGTFPPLNDSDRFSISSQSGFYDIAFRRYGDAKFVRWANPRNSELALLWGADTMPEAPIPAPAISTNSRSEGLAVLRNASNSTVAMLEYGPGLSGHVHPAKLNLVLFALGQLLIVDPGRISYGNALQNEWYTQTVAHNTLVVNQASQTRTRGVLRAFSAEPALIRAACLSAYPGVTMDRTLLLHENLLFDLLRCESKRDTTLDLPLHIAAQLEKPAAGTPVDALGKREGYQHLIAIQRLDPVPPKLSMRTPAGNRVNIHIAPETTVFTGVAPGNPPTQSLPFLLQRRNASSAVFATVLEIEDEAHPDRASEIVLFSSADSWGMAFDGVRLSAGPTTMIEIGEKRWEIGPNGILPSAP